MSAALLDDSLDQNVELWKIRKLIKSLELCRGFINFIYISLFYFDFYFYKIYFIYNCI